jgi:hypothetical protein
VAGDGSAARWEQALGKAERDAEAAKVRRAPPPPSSYQVDTQRPSPRTNRTRFVPHPVLIGHAASLTPYPYGPPRSSTRSAHLALPRCRTGRSRAGLLTRPCVRRRSVETIGVDLVQALDPAPPSASAATDAEVGQAAAAAGAGMLSLRGRDAAEGDGAGAEVDGDHAHDEEEEDAALRDVRTHLGFLQLGRAIEAWAEVIAGGGGESSGEEEARVSSPMLLRAYSL